jgi:5'-3' exonuclease
MPSHNARVGEHLFLDGPSLVFRAFFGFPKTVTDAQGRPVNAVRGFLDMITRLLEDRHPEEIVAVFGIDKPDFRVEAYPPYKAHRAEDPEELPHQFELIGEVLDAAGLRFAEAVGYEADDAIATLCKEVPSGHRYMIVTGDRDLLCLVRDPTVGVLFTLRGVSDLHQFDAEAVRDKYGIPPELYEEFAILRGDPSDGMPGVAGIGPVRATALLNQFGSIAGILENLDQLPKKQAAAFEAARNYLHEIRPVVDLRTDAPVEMTERHDPDETQLKILADQHNLGGSVSRLARALTGSRN